MANLLRMGFMSGMFVVVALAAALVQPEWAQDLGLEQWHAVYLQEILLCDCARQDQLHEQDRALMQRIDRKQAIVNELLDGRLSLFEAAALFRRLNEDLPTRLDSPYFQNLSEEECLCRQVIQWVRAGVTTRHCTVSKEFVEQLEESLRRHLERNGMVVLPDVVVTP